ncbi:hypothetical protein AX14_012968 [Amanita brunnescens Koide BX004]|nr:hypothetical protein AX14_012968 [Amanita brunnescens Koide BX004]
MRIDPVHLPLFFSTTTAQLYPCPGSDASKSAVPSQRKLFFANRLPQPRPVESLQPLIKQSLSEFTNHIRFIDGYLKLAQLQVMACVLTSFCGAIHPSSPSFKS